MNTVKRMAALRERLGSEDVGAAIVTNVADILYLTGWDGVFDTEPAHAAIVTDTVARLYTDSRYAEAAGAAARAGEWQVSIAAEGVVADACAAVEVALAPVLAFESTLIYRHYETLRSGYSGELKMARRWVGELRAIKEPTELERISAAQELTDAAFDHVRDGVLRPGATEREIALELEFWMRRHGSDGVAFDPIVASGPNSALPHAMPSDRPLAAGDLVVLDFGARVGGYCADMTRTVVIGKASARQREIYETVLAANLAGIAAVKPGRPGCDIDGAARSVIDAAGFGESFGHGLGHGVGLEVHELPGVGKRSTEPVPLGSVVTIEPGVYVPGFGGVRIEDLVVVEEAGARVLTRSTKELIEV
ncbi:MAG: aminopeptidase P family protein [Actinomycetes bacterium]